MISQVTAEATMLGAEYPDLIHRLLDLDTLTPARVSDEVARLARERPSMFGRRVPGADHHRPSSPEIAAGIAKLQLRQAQSRMAVVRRGRMI